MGRSDALLRASRAALGPAQQARTLTKSSPTKATGAHVSIVGHITRDELRSELTRTDAANGFANRFLWVCARRSKLLPEGGNFEAEDRGPIHRALRRAIDFARLGGELRLDVPARERWPAIYAELAGGQPGLFGAVTSRAEPQVLRLALVTGAPRRLKSKRAGVRPSDGARRTDPTR